MFRSPSRLVVFAGLFFVVLMAACNSHVVLQAQRANPPVVYRVTSLDSLVQHLPQLVGTNVEVRGFFTYEFEHVGLYPVSLNDAPLARDPSQGLWLSPALSLVKDDTLGLDSLALCRNREVRVRGRISSEKGHLGQYAGTLENVIFMECD